MKILRVVIGYVTGLLLAEVLVLAGFGAALSLGALIQRVIHCGLR